MNKNVLDFGAVADEKTDNTDIFNEAVAACADSGGGYVIVPAGRYITGTIQLKSNVVLWLEPGSVLLASFDPEKIVKTSRRKEAALVIADNIENSGIIGQGTIDVNRDDQMRKANPGITRPLAVVMDLCTNFKMEDITLMNSGWFTIYCMYCTNVNFSRIRIFTRNCENGDGIDFSGSKNVTISDCILNTGDDAIGLKTHYPNDACENFTITNCVITTRWAGIRLGPETCGDMKNITISNCTFYDCADAIKIQLCDSFLMQDITVSNLSMYNVVRPFFLTSSSCPMSGRTAKRRPDPGKFRRLLINNVVATINSDVRDWFDPGCLIQGLPDGVIEDVEISNFHMINVGKGTKEQAEVVDHPDFVLRNGYPDLPAKPFYPSCGFHIRNAKNIKIYNAVFDNHDYDERTAIAADAVENLKLFMVEARNCAGLLRHYKVSGLQTSLCEGDIVSFTEKQSREWEAARKIALEQEEMVIKVCNFADDIRRNPAENIIEKKDFKSHRDAQPSELIKDCSFVADFTELDKYAYYISSTLEGSISVSIDGEEIFHWDRPLYYDRSHMFALRLPLKAEGKHEIKLETDKEKGGIRGSVILQKKPINEPPIHDCL